MEKQRRDKKQKEGQKWVKYKERKAHSGMQERKKQNDGVFQARLRENRGFTHLLSKVCLIRGKLSLSSVNHQMWELKGTSEVLWHKSFIVQMSSPAKEGDLPVVTQQLNAGRIPECQTPGWGHFHQEVLLPSHPSSESRHWPLTREILLVAS